MAGTGVGQTDRLHLDKSEHSHRAHLQDLILSESAFVQGLFKCVCCLSVQI